MRDMSTLRHRFVVVLEVLIVVQVNDATEKKGRLIIIMRKASNNPILGDAVREGSTSSI